MSGAAFLPSAAEDLSSECPAPAATVSPAMRLAIFTSCLPAIRLPQMEEAPAPKVFEGPVDGQCDDVESFMEGPPVQVEQKLPGGFFQDL